MVLAFLDCSSRLIKFCPGLLIALEVPFRHSYLFIPMVSEMLTYAYAVLQNERRRAPS